MHEAEESLHSVLCSRSSGPAVLWKESALPIEMDEFPAMEMRPQESLAMAATIARLSLSLGKIYKSFTYFPLLLPSTG
jgi:hypothetical protein